MGRGVKKERQWVEKEGMKKKEREEKEGDSRRKNLKDK